MMDLHARDPKCLESQKTSKSNHSVSEFQRQRIDFRGAAIAADVDSGDAGSENVSCGAGAADGAVAAVCAAVCAASAAFS